MKAVPIDKLTKDSVDITLTPALLGIVSSIINIISIRLLTINLPQKRHQDIYYMPNLKDDQCSE